MLYFPLIDRIIEFIKALHPKHQLKIPVNPKKSRVVIVVTMIVILTNLVIIGVTKLVSFIFSLPNYELELLLIGILLLSLGELILRKPIDGDYAKKWWLGEISWWK